MSIFGLVQKCEVTIHYYPLLFSSFYTIYFTNYYLNFYFMFLSSLNYIDISFTCFCILLLTSIDQFKNVKLLLPSLTIYYYQLLFIASYYHFTICFSYIYSLYISLFLQLLCIFCLFTPLLYFILASYISFFIYYIYTSLPTAIQSHTLFFTIPLQPPCLHTLFPISPV